MTHTHEINGWNFILEEYDTNEWFWSNAESESKSYFATQSEALQDAINWIGNRARVEHDEAEEREIDRKYGTERQQANSLWMATR